MLRAIRLGIEDDLLLEEIGDLYTDTKPTFAITCYDRATHLNTERGELFQKYGSVIMKHRKNEISKAIDLLKTALDKIRGDQHKSHVALILQEALKEDGRDEEAEEYAQYTQNNSSVQ